MADPTVQTWAPGRVNLIGDHTDHTGGMAMPMAIDLGTSVVGRPGGDHIELTSEAFGSTVHLPIEVEDPSSFEPPWGRYVAGVVAETRPKLGFVGRITSDLPIGAGVSSSASLEVAVALAVGPESDPRTVAALCQRAEQRASGVPCGIMDHLTSTSGIDDHALLMDCHHLSITPVVVPDQARFVVVDSGQARELAGSAYARRRADCEEAETLIGPLRSAGLDAVETISDPVLRRRARHVVSENERVRSFAAALASGELREAGRLMQESHRSLAVDFEVSTDALDELVAGLLATDGVHGARLTGAGFGGSVVALTDPGVDIGGWAVRPAAGARRIR